MHKPVVWVSRNMLNCYQNVFQKVRNIFPSRKKLLRDYSKTRFNSQLGVTISLGATVGTPLGSTLDTKIELSKELPDDTGRFLRTASRNLQVEFLVHCLAPGSALTMNNCINTTLIGPAMLSLAEENRGFPL
ncbi:hypothetical protein TNCV_1039961 [Trichonephila clavipes]|nr:hypothetical protein TNCV_1039961 [Trichonephila clavipes]